MKTSLKKPGNFEWRPMGNRRKKNNRWKLSLEPKGMFRWRVLSAEKRESVLRRDGDCIILYTAFWKKGKRKTSIIHLVNYGRIEKDKKSLIAFTGCERNVSLEDCAKPLHVYGNH